tara:strand:+ start:323 stop:592 length:270 start_codon:yes stop_codon:yes gene_type:complete
MATAIRTNQTVESDMMETMDGESYWMKGISPTLYACGECKLMWDRKWQAQECGNRNHVKSFQQHYGGIVENNVYKPRASYTRKSYGYWQ